MEQNRIGGNDIMVFSFAKNSQFNSVEEAKHEYDYVFRILNKMLSEQGVDVPKIALAGYIKDLACHIAFIIKTYHLHRAIASVEVSDFDPAEFDPDVEPIILSGEQDSDHIC